MLSFALLARYVLLGLKWEYIHIYIPRIHNIDSMYTSIYIYRIRTRFSYARGIKKVTRISHGLFPNGFGTVTALVIKITYHETPLSIRKYCYVFRYKCKRIAVKTQCSFGFNICINIAADKLCLSTVTFCVRVRPERISRRKITGVQDRIHQGPYPRDVAG